MQTQPTNSIKIPQWKYQHASQSFKKVIQLTLQQKNQLFSCNKTAQILKEMFEKVYEQDIKENKLIHHKKQFPPAKCENSLIKTLGIQKQLRQASMIRFPLHDIPHNYDHYITIFKQTCPTSQIQLKLTPNKLQKAIWLLVHSWQNIYSLQNWVYDVDIWTIATNLHDQQFDPIQHLKDFIGYYNQKWFYEFYKDKQHQKKKVFNRFEEVFSFNSNDHRRMREIEWYQIVQE